MRRCAPLSKVSSTATARGVICSGSGARHCAASTGAKAATSVTAQRDLRYRYLVMDLSEKVPDFTLPDQNGEPVKLSDFKGKPVVLFFYPRANTPGCTVEACGFRDNYGNLTRAGLVVLGISPDTPKAQKSFET